ncbi:MAG: dephospho-CoA kinase [Zoogloeaceae bacterium]|jgi:dephospho-CoA kinase|nr:dephospho-CoA kinase [Zoogloeaceae bacterium]
MPFKVGLTGGIGSGKSTVARAFVELGAGLVDTDDIAHRLTAHDGEALPLLAAAFGTDILAADGSLNRARMRQKVFADALARRRLEDILHPLIRAHALAGIGAVRAPWLLIDIPLLVAVGRESYALDRVLVVDCPEALQIERVMARSGFSAPEVAAMMAAQSSRAERLAIADDVIDNSGSRTELLPQIAALHQRYLHMAQRQKYNLS